VALFELFDDFRRDAPGRGAFAIGEPECIELGFELRCGRETSEDAFDDIAKCQVPQYFENLWCGSSDLTDRLVRCIT
jgi:hypothetical protein